MFGREKARHGLSGVAGTLEASESPIGIQIGFGKMGWWSVRYLDVRTDQLSWFFFFFKKKTYLAAVKPAGFGRAAREALRVHPLFVSVNKALLLIINKRAGVANACLDVLTRFFHPASYYILFKKTRRVTMRFGNTTWFRVKPIWRGVSTQMKEERRRRRGV